MHLVTRGHFLSRDKDSDRTIRSFSYAWSLPVTWQR